MKEVQQPMFSYEDTPLFSGTAQVVKDSTFTPRVVEIQDSMFTCPLCHDTGRITTRNDGRVTFTTTCPLCDKGAT